jgi:DnaD/phage-associated family protein
MPKYSGMEISEMLDKDGGRLREMIDECQQIIGHIFRPNEVNTVLGLCDWLGLEPDYVITIFAYFVEKKPGCNIRYIEKAAIDLVNEDIITLDDLDNYIKERELYEGIAGNLRALLGIGGRAYTKKENDLINRWASTYGYSFEIIKLAYEICCDANGRFSFDYTGKILETWYNAGVRTLDDAKKEHNAFREQKKKGSDLAKSFDTSEFFSNALNRSYKNMGTKPEDKK